MTLPPAECLFENNRDSLRKSCNLKASAPSPSKLNFFSSDYKTIPFLLSPYNLLFATAQTSNYVARFVMGVLWVRLYLKCITVDRIWRTRLLFKLGWSTLRGCPDLISPFPASRMSLLVAQSVNFFGVPFHFLFPYESVSFRDVDTRFPDRFSWHASSERDTHELSRAIVWLISKPEN